MLRKVVLSGAILSLLACGSAQAGGHTGAILGGVAAGVVGGAVLGSVLSQHPAPVYVQPAPPPVEYVEPAPQRVYAQPADDFEGQLFRLHSACDDGNRRACIRFGIMIGQHRERVAQWRRSHPDFFAYED